MRRCDMKAGHEYAARIPGRLRPQRVTLSSRVDPEPGCVTVLWGSLAKSLRPQSVLMPWADWVARREKS